MFVLDNLVFWFIFANQIFSWKAIAKLKTKRTKQNGFNIFIIACFHTCMAQNRSRLRMTCFHILLWARQLSLLNCNHLIHPNNIKHPWPIFILSEVCRGRGSIWRFCFISRDNMMITNKYTDCVANTKCRWSPSERYVMFLQDVPKKIVILV